MINIFSKTKTLITSHKTISLVLFFLFLGLFTLNFNTSKRLENKIEKNKVTHINQERLKNIGTVAGEEIENMDLAYTEQQVLADQSTENQPASSADKQPEIDESFIKKILRKFKFSSKNIKRHAIESDDIDSKSITSRTIKNNTIKGKDIKDGTIGGDKIKSDIDLIANSVTSNTITTTGDLTVGGTIYGTVSGAASSFSGDMAGSPILNIGDNATDFTATGGLTLADILIVSSGGFNVTGDSSIIGILNLNNNPLINIGAAGTDFTVTGGLTLADGLTVSSGGANIAGNINATTGLYKDYKYLVLIDGSDYNVYLGSTGALAYTNTVPQEAIQYALDNTGGGSAQEKVLVVGAYTFDSDEGGIALQDYTTFELRGSIDLANTGSCSLAGNADYCAAIVKNKSLPASNIEVVGGEYDGNDIGSFNMAVNIAFSGVVGGSIKDVWSHHATVSHGIALQATVSDGTGTPSSNIEVDNVTVNDNSDDGIGVNYDVNDVKITNSNISGSFGVEIEDGAYNVVVGPGNHFDTSDNWAIYIIVDPAADDAFGPPHDILVTGNIFEGDRSAHAIVGGAQRAEWISSVTCVDSGGGACALPDDITTTGTYDQDPPRTEFVVEIDGVGSPNTFQWSDVGGVTWNATGVAITESPQSLSQGVSITFANNEGHDDEDQWSFYAISEEIYNVVITGNTITNSVNGISITNCNACVVSNNTICDNAGAGIGINGTIGDNKFGSTVISNNNVCRNYNAGIYVQEGKYMNISNNNIYDNGYKNTSFVWGIDINNNSAYDTYHNIKNNNVYLTSSLAGMKKMYGIRLRNASYNRIDGNIFNNLAYASNRAVNHQGTSDNNFLGQNLGYSNYSALSNSAQGITACSASPCSITTGLLQEPDHYTAYIQDGNGEGRVIDNVVTAGTNSRDLSVTFDSAPTDVDIYWEARFDFDPT